MRPARKRINDRNYYARHSSQKKAAVRAYYAANREIAIAAVRESQRKNPEITKANWRKSAQKLRNQIRKQAATFFWLLGVKPTEEMMQLKILHIKTIRCLPKKKPIE